MRSRRTCDCRSAASQPQHPPQEHPDEARLPSDGLKHADIYAQYGLAPRKSCWQYIAAEGAGAAGEGGMTGAG
jgi:hypothetical protein